MENNNTFTSINPNTSRIKSWGGILLIFTLLVSGCVPAKETPSVPSAAPVQQPTQPSTPNIIVMTPTPAVSLLLPTPGLDFCNNEQVQSVLTALIDAVTQKDGAALSSLIDPAAGLDIFITSANPPVNIPAGDAAGLFDSTFAYSWGDQPASGLPVEGTFSAEILPSLLDVMDRSYAQACQSLERGTGTGPTTAVVEWPEEYARMPFIALYRVPGPQDNELDWRTWAVGFTVVDGVPKIRVLVQYFWEI